MTNELLNALNGQYEVSTCGCQDFWASLKSRKIDDEVWKIFLI